MTALLSPPRARGRTVLLGPLAALLILWFKMRMALI
jgi:hypothetical protein